MGIYLKKKMNYQQFYWAYDYFAINIRQLHFKQKKNHLGTSTNLGILFLQIVVTLKNEPYYFNTKCYLRMKTKFTVLLSRSFIVEFFQM